jgi:H+-transporting ATPase
VKPGKPLKDVFKEPSHDDDERHGEAVDFVKSKGLTSAEADELLRRFGRNELEEKKTPKWIIFAKLLIQPMPIMIW